MFSSTVGFLALGFVFVPLHVKSYRGRWLDYRRRLQSIASTLTIPISLPQPCLGSPRFSVAPMSSRQCSRPAGRVFPAAYRATSFISTTTSTSSITACERSLFNTCGLQEAESFPAAQNLSDCLCALGVSSMFGVPGLFSAVFPLTTVGRTSLSNVPNGNRERHEPAACALPQADQKSGKLHSTLLVDRSGMTFFFRKGRCAICTKQTRWEPGVADPISQTFNI